MRLEINRRLAQGTSLVYNYQKYLFNKIFFASI